VLPQVFQSDFNLECWVNIDTWKTPTRVTTSVREDADMDEADVIRPINDFFGVHLKDD